MATRQVARNMQSHNCLGTTTEAGKPGDIQRVNAACLPAVGYHDSPVPDTCTPACALVFAPWWRQCGGLLQLDSALQQLYSTFFVACKETLQNDGH